MSEIKSFVCNEPQRLDAFLASQLDDTRSQIAALIKSGFVKVDNKATTKNGLKLKEGQSVLIEIVQAKQTKPQDIDFDVEILYEDDDILVINKPSGVTVHPAPSVKEPTLVDWLKHKDIRLSTISGQERHGIVHRLDKGTSGAMVVAKTNEAHEFLSLQLQDKTMGRYYLAVINPPLKEELTTVELNIGRSTHNRLKMACSNSSKSKSAKTMFKVLALSNDENLQLVACKLFTGRTHQIRVHLESMNRHILGDHIYAQSPKMDKSERILLHAYIIYFIHPKSKEKLFFSAPLDSVTKDFIEKKFDMEQINEVTDTSTILRGFPTTTI
ncbi:MAG: RluA family pseudouridine synthase [Sulfurimonas sp.]|uniref:RluA family pseudouridine synthase n=1 Tax=Sulfurimonas sp. TaxID=2022749 RepID=UPI0025D46DFD|nr:RluA family pseudouridine synthase [Sulfurimonas sp.]MCK9490820.1 RluA family pseudouridine synthase [Sulfurimonas sp.]